MTVDELIAELHKHHGDATVVIETPEVDHYDVTGVMVLSTKAGDPYVIVTSVEP